MSLRRRTPLRPIGARRKRRPPVDWGALRPRVFTRDEARCMAPVLDPSVDPAECRSRFGRPAVIARAVGRLIYDVAALTLDHVHAHAGGTHGEKAPDDEQHLVTLCWHHHLDGWATANRGLLRSYLRSLYGAIA